MVWPLSLPPLQSRRKPPRLQLRIYDKDITSPDDAIAEATLPLARLCNRALACPDKRTYYTRNGEKDFWLRDLKNPTPTKQSKQKLPRMKIRVELVPKAIADEQKVGLGRSQPNAYPFLPPPE